MLNHEALPVTPDGRPVQPNDIDISKHLYGAFGHWQTESSALHIIGLCQQKGGWEPFTQKEVEAYYQSKGYEGEFTFNALVEPVTEWLFDSRSHVVGGGYIIREGNKYKITPQFIERAFRSSPAAQKGS